MAAPAKHALSEARLAAMAGVSETTWKAHKAQGCPVPRAQKDIAGWLATYHEWRRKHGKFQVTSQAPPLDPETQRHKRDHAKWRAVLAQLDVGVRTRQLIPRAEVIDYIARANLTCRTRLNLLVSKMASRLVNESAETIRRELQAEVDSICAAFAQGMLLAHESGAGSEIAGDVGAAEAVDGL